MLQGLQQQGVAQGQAGADQQRQLETLQQWALVRFGRMLR